MNPSDPVCTAWQLSGPDETIYICPSEERHRAAVQAYWAHELSSKFAHVRVTKRYVRIFTRQEAWNHEGREAEFESKLHQQRIGYYFQPDCYCYDPVAPPGNPVPVNPLLIESMRGPSVVPDDYEVSHCGAAWEYVSRDHPDAIPVWYAEPW